MTEPRVFYQEGIFPHLAQPRVDINNYEDALNAFRIAKEVSRRIIVEKYITGEVSDKEKFQKWAETVPYTMRNPLYHWTHLELQRYFGITDLLNKTSGVAIYEKTTAQLQQADFSTQNLLKNKKVEVVCTTDDPTDSLEYHQQNISSQLVRK